MGDKVLTVGVEMPDDFPTEDYNYIHAKMQPVQGSKPSAFDEYGGGWNALAYRFSFMAEHDAEFREALPDDDRYKQERGLVGFFVSGLSVIESCCYSIYFMGSVVDPASFPSSTQQDLKNITPEATAIRFTDAFPRHEVSGTLAKLIKHDTYKEWRLVRNVLAHRASPGRTIRVQLPADRIGITDSPESARSTPSQRAQQSRADTWKLKGLSIEDALTSTRRAWLVDVLTNLLWATRRFVDDNLRRSAGQP